MAHKSGRTSYGPKPGHPGKPAPKPTPVKVERARREQAKRKGR